MSQSEFVRNDVFPRYEEKKPSPQQSVSSELSVNVNIPLDILAVSSQNTAEYSSSPGEIPTSSALPFSTGEKQPTNSTLKKSVITEGIIGGVALLILASILLRYSLRRWIMCTYRSPQTLGERKRLQRDSLNMN